VIEPVLPDVLYRELKELVREVFREEISGQNEKSTESEKLLTAAEAATLMNVKPRWLYRYAVELTFTRRINRKTLRFSEAGIRRWLATKKPLSSR